MAGFEISPVLNKPEVHYSSLVVSDSVKARTSVPDTKIFWMDSKIMRTRSP